MEFKPGDRVKPKPNNGWADNLLHEPLIVLEVNQFGILTVQWCIGKYDQFTLPEDDFIFDEESIVDKVLEKYQN